MKKYFSYVSACTGCIIIFPEHSITIIRKMCSGYTWVTDKAALMIFQKHSLWISVKLHHQQLVVKTRRFFQSLCFNLTILTYSNLQTSLKKNKGSFTLHCFLSLNRIIVNTLPSLNDIDRVTADTAPWCGGRERSGLSFWKGLVSQSKGKKGKKNHRGDIRKVIHVCIRVSNCHEKKRRALRDSL